MDDKKIKETLDKLGVKDTDGSYRIDPDTGKVQKEGFWGWSDTSIRIEKGTGKVQKEGFWGWSDTGTRVEKESGKVQKEGFWGHSDEGVRIEKESGKVQKEGFFGYSDSGTRVEKDSGRVKDDKCFITTACIRAKGLPDDCSELMAFRNLRDDYVKSLPNGESLISEYNTIAPALITAINDEANSREIYLQLYEDLVVRTSKLILSRRREEAFELCFNILTNLKKRYMSP